MNGFLLNMINRHQGLVEQVQPRVRSMFEPETAPAVAGDNAFAGAADTIVKESRDTGLEPQAAFSKSPIIEKSTPDTPPSAMFPQADQGFMTSGLHSFDKNGMELMNEQIRKQSLFSNFPGPEQATKADQSTPENPPSAMLRQPAQTFDPYGIDRNRLDLMNQQIQGVLARLGRKPDIQEPFNNAKNLQDQDLSDLTDQTTSQVVANEQSLANGIEETLRRLKNQTSIVGEGERGLQDDTHTVPANAVKTEADPLIISPQSGKKAGEPAEPLNKLINQQAQAVNTPKNSPDGVLQIPGWLTELQTNLNNRWREINAKSQAEPVINVTIGRVEVRAMNMEPVKPPAAQGKPKGVLSLDEYLKQRESKGRT